MPKIDIAPGNTAIVRRLSNAGEAKYAPRASFGPRIQSDYQLVLVHTGLARVEVDGSPRYIPAGHVGLLLPGRREYFTFSADCGTHHTWIAVPPRLLDSALCATLDTAAHCVALSAAMQRCVEAGCAVAAVDNPEEFTVLAAAGRAALMLYAEEAKAAAAARTREHPAMAVVRRHAREGAREGLGVSDLARAVHLSPEHLIRLCRRDLKTTPGALLRSERLSHAMQLLAHTGLPVSEIAHRSGFASQQHFARSVRAATGLSPSGFRRLSWQAQDERLC